MVNQNIETAGIDKKSYWEKVYSKTEPYRASWYQSRPSRSLALIEATGAGESARIIDIGGGASTLTDYLLDAGYRDLTVLDIAQGAIEQAKLRLGDHAEKVSWLVQDVTATLSAGLYDVWHDRAVFHFLTDIEDRSHYVDTMTKLLKPGAHAIIATFALNGPAMCSGLDVVQYSAETLSSAIGDAFQLVDSSTEAHLTPGGFKQNFIYCLFWRS
jgi:2-polyprenyl-3-methyl-5-hydroxy-6-metoxy-1,4-benzoquinol methylase